MIKAIIFDLDGVLVDTKKIHFEALNLALKKFSYSEITFEDHIKIFDGLPTNEKLKILNKKINLPKKNFSKIISRKYNKININTKGTYHSKKELPRSMISWNMKIKDYLKFYFR